MDLSFVLFKFTPALKFIFQISYIPSIESDFKELTPEQYASYYRQADERESKELPRRTLLAFLPDDPKVYNRLIKMHGDQLIIVSADDLPTFVSASEFIDKCCKESGKDFDSLEDKLVYLAQKLPGVFTQGTPYAMHGMRKNETGKQ